MRRELLCINLITQPLQRPAHQWGPPGRTCQNPYKESDSLRVRLTREGFALRSKSALASKSGNLPNTHASRSPTSPDSFDTYIFEASLSHIPTL